MNQPYSGSGNVKQGPYPIKDIVRQSLRMWGISHTAAARQDRLATIWQEIVDQETAVHTRVIGLRGGILRVEVDSAARLQELSSFKKAELLAALKGALPERHIRDIRFIAGSGPGSRRLKKKNLQ